MEVHGLKLSQFLTHFCVCVSAGISEKVGTKPVGVEVLGQKLVLFRGSDGVIHCLHGALRSVRQTDVCVVGAA